MTQLNSPRSFDSLQNFFDNTQAASLSACDQEQVHLSGRIQSLGALLVLDRETNRLIGGSPNTAAFLGTEIHGALGAPLSEFDADLADALMSCGQGDPASHIVLDEDARVDNTIYDTVVHFGARQSLLEFLPNSEAGAQGLKQKVRRTARCCSAIQRSESLEDAFEIAVTSVRELTGFDRAKIYQFQPDWSGHVIAEARAHDDTDSFLGLCFPDTDIPQQARAMYSLMPCRAIGSAFDENTQPVICDATQSGPPDLSYSLLRSVSPMHTAYLRNMGVSASFSISLMSRGKLWGLISCHHHSEIWMPYDDWGLGYEIGAALMRRVEMEEDAETTRNLVRVRRIEHEIAVRMRQKGDIESVIAEMIPMFQEFLNSDGFALCYGDQLYTSGTTPPDTFIRDLLSWANLENPDDQLCTTQLHADWSPAGEHMDTACGVLMQPIVAHRVCQLIWFRRPITKSVAWAGQPQKVPASDDPLAGLMPRNSFARWESTHSDQSMPWRQTELESAREVLKEILDIVASQLLLSRENEELKDIASQLAMKEQTDAIKRFVGIAVHDLKAPLRGINFALEMMREDGFDPEVVDEAYSIAEVSSQRMQNLTSDLLQLAEAQHTELQTSTVNTGELVESARKVLSGDSAAAGAVFDIGPLPGFTGDAARLRRLFDNLLGNAIKYRDPTRAPHIRITGEDRGEQIVLRVADNGMGIPAHKAEYVFEPMQRLHSQDEIEGTGLGLAICRALVEAHGGSIRIDPAYTGGTCFVITLPKHARS
ncbi:ATP-binding protein [uncultured Roseobacter sp.]|uniref:ATP-binding protein n=1 Tax=uncultured Roseobacter sp. TaxID=114847 RepID=UPI00260C1965|nr:ATP-binding protein [uncultured Roseobacter sp.]